MDGSRMSKEDLKVFTEIFKRVFRKFQGCFKGISRILGCFKNVSRVFRECFIGVRESKRSLKGVSRDFQRC